MKRILWIVLVLLLTASLMLTACAQPATEAPPEEVPAEPDKSEEPVGEEVTATIGFTASLTGKLNKSSSRQTNGFNLWLKEVNDAGGIQLSDGTVVKFDAKSYDDESNKDRVQELYTILATEDNADFLISPYSSGLTAAAAVIAEQYEKIMITTGAASDSTYKQGFSLVFQAYTPASNYLTGALDLLKATDESAKKIAIVYENAKFSTDVSTALKEYAEANGYEVVLFEGYDSETTDFAPFINKIQDAGPDAVLGGGHYQDGSTFARQLYEKNVPLKFVAILVAPPDIEFAELGDAAYGIIGPSQWEPLAAFTEENAKAAGKEWIGPAGDKFVEAFEAAYGEEPTYHAAGGYIAGLLLQKAIEKASSLDSQAVKAALESFDLLSFYGGIKFDTSTDAHGLQIGHSMIYIQWHKNDAGELVKQVVWPAEGKTSDIIYPLR